MFPPTYLPHHTDLHNIKHASDLGLGQYWPNQHTREYFKVGGVDFVGSLLTEITNNRFHDVLAQITRDNFFLWKDKDKKEVCVDTNHN